MTFGTSKSLFCGLIERNFIWIRFRGRLIFQCKNVVKHPPLFSERNGYVKFHQVGNWRFRFGERFVRNEVPKARG